MFNYDQLPKLHICDRFMALLPNYNKFTEVEYFGFNSEVVYLDDGRSINTTCIPENIICSNIKDVIDTNAPEKVFISPVGCKGILRRAEERKMKMNLRLEEIMRNVASQLPEEEIERISRIQPRGAFSKRIEEARIA
jgi:DNA (cytosine-5)-methyltransferase 1